MTAIEFELVPVRELYAGTLFFGSIARARCCKAWREWTESVPEEVTSCGKLPAARPRADPGDRAREVFSLVEVAFLGGETEGRELLAPLRDLGPEMDTFAMVPPAALSELHMDPVDPVPYMSGHALVGELPEQAIDELVAVTGPGSNSPLVSFEVRHGGGALAREAPGGGALASLPGEYMAFAVGAVMAPEMVPPLEAALERLGEALTPYDCGRYARSPNRPEDVRDGMFSARRSSACARCAQRIRV